MAAVGGMTIVSGPGQKRVRQPKFSVTESSGLLCLGKRRGNQQDRHRCVTTFRGVESGHGLVAAWVDSQAIERVGRIRDDAAAAQDVRRPRNQGVVWNISRN